MFSLNRIVLFALAALTHRTLSLPLSGAVSSPSVTLDSGIIAGTTTQMATATAAVTKFVGIPYAASPPERFGPPSPPEPWTTTLKATSTRAACLQNFAYPEASRSKEMALFNNPGFPAPKESEDCLYLNVYVPPHTTTSSQKAVMFWIYGGNLAFGTGTLNQYDGTSFAYNQDVILVTHNYRTNVFGFPGAPELQAPNQNPGFLDQRFALEWVRSNIAKFGGDPAKVTIFGESAGGYSVKDLIALPPNPLNFRAGIMESEAAAPADGGWQELVAQIGCSTATSQLACVRSKPAATIKDIVEKSALGFFPAVDNVTHVSDVRPAFMDGTAAKVPFMIGTNEDEGRVFAYILGLDSDPAPSLDTILKFLFPGQTVLQKTLAKVYAKEPVYEAASTIITQALFLCPASLLASLAHSKGFAVHRYLFNASFPNNALFPDPGVWHSTEIPEVFGTYSTENALGKATKQQIMLSEYMETAWANFAKAPDQGPGLGWPELGSTGTSGKVQNLGGNGINGGKTVTAGSIDQSCTLYDALVEVTGL